MHFSVSTPAALIKKLYEMKNKEKNGDLVNVIKSGLSDLWDEIENMCENEKKKNEKPNEMVDIVQNILEFNRQQEGRGLKILTPSQMLSRLPISLAQLKAGNNSEKLKNEIRQILHSLYKSKKLTKNIYKSLIDII